mmetsp:Transcript_627/g.972  ORF Transcript_627/g.972 Transcript_627/m.972 type:complete len:115 (+) Transcript_627:165-509(+)
MHACERERRISITEGHAPKNAFKRRLLDIDFSREKNSDCMGGNISEFISSAPMRFSRFLTFEKIGLDENSAKLWNVVKEVESGASNFNEEQQNCKKSSSSVENAKLASHNKTNA